MDIAEGTGCNIAYDDCPHFRQLRDKILLTDVDLEKARNMSVLESLVVLKRVHYNTKMMLAMTVGELYADYMVVPLDLRLAFEVLMSAIDWPISFSEIAGEAKRSNERSQNKL